MENIFILKLAKQYAFLGIHSHLVDFWTHPLEILLSSLLVII